MTPKDIISFHELILHEFQPNNTPDKTGDFAVNLLKIHPHYLH